jgi:hypothetical protein
MEKSTGLLWKQGTRLVINHYGDPPRLCRSLAMHITRPILTLSSAILSLTVVPLAVAQPIIAGTNAIETTVINADYVFVAKIIDFRAPQPGDDRGQMEAIIEIQETIKAEQFRDEPYDKLNINLPHRAEQIQAWKIGAHPMLIALTSFQDEQNTAIELDPESLEVMTADLQLLRDPEAVLQAARAAVHRLPANVRRVHTFRIIAPKELAALTRWSEYYHLEVTVPVDEHLEKWAQNIVRMGEKSQRQKALQALAYFRSDVNIALVQPFLQDPDFSFHSSDGQTGERFYFNRHAAYQTLRAWGVKTERPKFHEQVVVEQPESR